MARAGGSASNAQVALRCCFSEPARVDNLTLAPDVPANQLFPSLLGITSPVKPVAPKTSIRESPNPKAGCISSS